MKKGLFFLTLCVVAASVTCGGSSADKTCVPGASVACVGPGGCMSNQVCAADGTSFGPCTCGIVGPDGGMGMESGTDGAMDLDSAMGADGADSSSGGDSGPWTPKQLPGLAIWLDDDVGVVRDPQHATAIQKWKDQSGNGNDAVPAQGTQRYFEVDPQALGMHDGYYCPGNGSLLVVQDAASLQWGTSDFAIAVVVRWDMNAAQFWSKNANMNTGVSLYPNGNDVGLLVGAQGVLMAVQTYQKWHIVLAKAQKPLSLGVDGTNTAGPSASVNVSEVTRKLNLCQGSDGNITEIAEVIGAKGTLSVGDEAKLIGYLKTKFGL